jgi:hypothetical protein
MQHARRPHHRVPVGVLLSILAFGLVACNQLVLRTASAPQTACDAALVAGWLVSSRESGLALQQPGEPNLPVTWPFGYRTGSFVGGLELQDENGRVLAREGEFVEVGGGLGGDGSFIACAGTVRVVPVLAP